MKIESYDSSKHKEQVLTWYCQWDIDTSVIDIMPETGLIIQGIGVIFLYHMTEVLCNLESGVVNRYLDEETKQKAISKLTKAITELAKEKGYKKIVFYTCLDSVIEKAISAGWEKSEKSYYVMTKNLEK